MLQMSLMGKILPLFLLATTLVSGYRFGLLSDASTRGARFTALVTLAVEDVAAEVPIELVSNNTGLRTSDALFATTWQLQRGNILGSIGPLTTQEMSGVAVSAVAYNVPVFSPVASSEYSDKILYPNVFRARATDENYAYALEQLMRQLDAKVLGIVSSADIYGNGLLNSLTSMSPPPTFETRVARFSPSPDPNAYKSILAAVQELKDKGVRVICFHAAPANMVMILNVTATLGLVNHPEYQIVLNADMAAAVQQTAGVKPEVLKGALAFALHLPVGTDEYKALDARCKARWPTLFGTYGPNFNELHGYDSVLGYAHTIQKLLADGKAVTPSNIASTLAKMTWPGVTGEVKFDAKLTRVYPFDVWSYQGSVTQVVVGYYDPRTDAPMQLDRSKVLWPGGASEPIWDGFSLRHGQDLPPEVTGALSALSFFVSMLSAWCCIVLIEQATYGVTRKLRIWHWSLLTGTLWGVCGIWGSSLVSYGSVSFPLVGHVSLHPGYTMLAFAISLVTGVAVFFLGIIGVNQLHINAAKATRTQSYNTPTGDQDHDTSVTASSQRQGSVTQMSSAKNSTQLEAQEENKKAKAQFTTLHRKINRWLLAAMVVQVAGVTAVLTILDTVCLPGWVKFNANVGVAVGGVVLDLLFSFIGLLFTFHFLPVTPIRSIGCLPMTLGVFLHGQVVMTASGYLYQANVMADLSKYWQYDDVALAIAVVTVALVMGLIAYNVFSMKLSRNSLDVHMAQFKKQFKQLIEQVDSYKALTMTKERQREQLWRMLELITLGRPLGRDHALAMALADFVQDPLQNGQLLPVSTPNQEKDKEDDRAVSVEATLNRPKREETSIMHTYEKLIRMQNVSCREMRLEDLVAHPVTCELLKDAMAKHHDVESLMLYLDIQHYKKIENSKVRAFMAREIYDCFLAKGAKYEVNVSDTLRRPFHQRFGFDKGQLSPAAETSVPADFFAEVEREMRNLLQTNGMARLQSSGMDQLCGQLLRMLKVPVKTSGGSGPAVTSKQRLGLEKEKEPADRQSSPSPARLSLLETGRSSSSSPQVMPMVTVSHSAARGIAHVTHRPVFAPSPTVEAQPVSPPPEATIAWAPPV